MGTGYLDDLQVAESADIIQFNGEHQNGGFVEKNDLRETEGRENGGRGREGLV